jgi:acyl-coenzyme A synthetase/AMP-(fatty) acid ligase
VVKEVTKEARQLEVILVEENSFLSSRNGIDFEKIFSEDGSTQDYPEALDLDVDNDSAIVTFTSGTTGYKASKCSIFY